MLAMPAKRGTECSVVLVCVSKSNRHTTANQTKTQQGIIIIIIKDSQFYAFLFIFYNYPSTTNIYLL